MDDIIKALAIAESERKTIFINQKKADEDIQNLKQELQTMQIAQEVANKEIPYWIKEAVAEGNKISQRFFIEELESVKNEQAFLKTKLSEMENKPSKVISKTVIDMIKYAVLSIIGLIIGILFSMIGQGGGG